MSTYIKNIIYFLTLVLLFVVTHVSHASINQQLTYFGSLQNSSGTELSGSYDMVFRIYDTPTGGTPLATSTHTTANGNPVTVTNGEFNVLLGSGTGNSLSGVNFNTSTLYLGITVGSDSEMVPRERFSSAPSSFNTDLIDGYDSSELVKNNATNTIETSSTDTITTLVQHGSGDILNLFRDSTEVFTVTDGGYVGVGTTSPTHALVVTGDTQITGALYDSLNTSGASGYVLKTTGAGVEWIATSSISVGVGGVGLFTDAGSYTYRTETTDRLAIGTTTATDMLTVMGSVDLVNDGKLYLSTLQSAARFLSASSTSYSYGAGQFSAPDDLSFVGVHNQFIGPYAGDGITTGDISYSDFLGYSSGQFATSSNFSSHVGAYSGFSVIGDFNSAVGYETGYHLNGDYNVGIGYQAQSYLNGAYNNAIGGEALYLIATGTKNNAFGYGAGWVSYGDTHSNQFFGYGSGAGNNSSHSIFFQSDSGNLSIGEHNIFLGQDSGYDNGLGSPRDGNIYIGDYIATFAEDNAYNVVMGYNAGHYLNTASSTVVVGSNANYNYQTYSREAGDQDVIIGYRAAYSLAGNSRHNIIIGANANWYPSGAVHAITIGNSVLTGSDRVSIGKNLNISSSTATGTTIDPNARVQIHGWRSQAQFSTLHTVRFDSLGAGALQSDANGNLTVSSDERLKNITSFYTTGIEALMGLEPIIYKWNKESGLEMEHEYLGFSAQNVQMYIPEAVGEDKRGYLTLSDRGILATVVNAIKEVFAKLTHNETMLAELQAEITELQERDLALNTNLRLAGIAISMFDETSAETNTGGEQERPTTSSTGDPEPQVSTTTPDSVATSTDVADTGSDTQNTASSSPEGGGGDISATSTTPTKGSDQTSTSTDTIQDTDSDAETQTDTVTPTSTSGADETAASESDDSSADPVVTGSAEPEVVDEPESELTPEPSAEPEPEPESVTEESPEVIE